MNRPSFDGWSTKLSLIFDIVMTARLNALKRMFLGTEKRTYHDVGLDLVLEPGLQGNFIGAGRRNKRNLAVFVPSFVQPTVVEARVAEELLLVVRTVFINAVGYHVFYVRPSSR